ncbi:MAG: glycine--tRNA ligase [Deltaproteobacteria bacterium RIFCSPHIGHO2_02_FULL_40_11]|nr:MAG: glycine--tRNA ligase [Deltaproteobacteria bacterium RIFCSPHIGHO2_02_FULL_40_11]
MAIDMDQLVSLCKRRGFIFQSSEIYGGINSCWDYGPLGVELKNNIKRLWWQAMVNRQDIEGLDASILMHPKVWEASGHVEGFTDSLVDCKKCKHRFRLDQLTEKKCPDCGGELTEPRQFNLMFKTYMGPVESEANIVYLRPETAQGIYVNFLNVQSTMRHKIPFGIAQIGKAFRNEITPGNFVFRTREFEQMEMQYFVKPGEDKKWFEHWKEERIRWHQSIGLNEKKLRFHEHGKNELAHYAKQAFDIEFEFPFGWNEIEGIHNRGDFDLTRHQKFSGKSLEYFDDQSKEKYTPYVIETSVGADRTLLAVILNAYEEEKEGDEVRSVLRFHTSIAPIKVAFFPLMKKPELQALTHQLQDATRSLFRTRYDESGSIGRRYRRQDEIGTPLCVTVDFDSLEDKAVTVRDRDSMKQERVAIDQLNPYLAQKLGIR